MNYKAYYSFPDKKQDWKVSKNHTKWSWLELLYIWSHDLSLSSENSNLCLISSILTHE